MQKRYSKEFKETLIAFYHSGQSVTQLSKEYDVAPATIYKWIDLYSKSNESSVSKADFLELKRQLAKVKEERDLIVTRTQEGKHFAKLHDPSFREGRPQKFTEEQI
uniref:transposase n=1 Tax=Lactococcus lactis TaxID=1358 RepID=UPI0021531CD2